ncbi:MAG: hypothetical protein AAGF44_04055 [Pseudomonadota bacterium]
MRFCLIIMALACLYQPSNALGAKPNPQDVYACFEAQDRARTCFRAIYAPCGKWLKPKTYDLFSSCLRGLRNAWGTRSKGALGQETATRSDVEARQIQASVEKLKSTLRPECRSVADLDTGIVHLRDVPERICAVFVNAMIAYLIENKPESLLTGDGAEI